MFEDNYFITRYPLRQTTDEIKNRVPPRTIRQMLKLSKDPSFNPVMYVVNQYPYSSKLQLVLLNAFYKIKYNQRCLRRYHRYSKDSEIVKRVAEMRRQNYSIYRIAKELNLSTSSVKHIIDNYL